jgi:molecular chaperone DnaK
MTIAANPRIRKAVGIDLGTTNSVISMLDPSGTLLLTGRDAQGRQTLPSVVGWDEAQQKLAAGHEARSLPGKLPLSSIKRYMGLDRRFEAGPRSMTAQEVSAVLLKHLRGMMEASLGEEGPRHLLDLAVLTMPAYFNHSQIEATRQAGELAGLEVAELLHEPTAAAIFYSWHERHRDAVYLVYDLGGGTFDVSVIRRRLGDHEVLAVSGDPFLGGDDFDRSLASHLLDVGLWRAVPPGGMGPGERLDPHEHFPPSSEPFARLVRQAESIKMELSEKERCERYVPRLATLSDGRDVSLEASVTRQAFEKLIRERCARTVELCHEALGRARERAGIRLRDIAHVVLVGGSCRVPLVREVVREAFTNPSLRERVQSSEILCHEPDLAVAYGAALRAAGHGTRFLWPMRGGSLELHVTSPPVTATPEYEAAGVVKLRGVPGQSLEGSSVRIRSSHTGLVDEVFLDRQGGLSQTVEVAPEGPTTLEWAICDQDGLPTAVATSLVTCQPDGRALGQGVLATQMITRALAIEVLDRSRRRVKQVVAPVGAALPGTFRCVCRTTDQTGRIVVPIFEDSRVIKHLDIRGIDRTLPAGSPVEVTFTIDARHQIEVSVKVRSGSRLEREESATIEPPPPPSRPTRQEIEEALRELEQEVGQLAGKNRARLKARAAQAHSDLLDALTYDDEPRAIQRMSELRALIAQAERIRTVVLSPPWAQFSQAVEQALALAADVAQKTQRSHEELVDHIRAQERYAEQAYEEANPALYRECWESLEKYTGYLQQLLQDALPRPVPRPKRPPEVEARDEVERFRSLLSSVWKQAKEKKRPDVDYYMGEIARQAAGLSTRLREDPEGALDEARGLIAQIEKQRSRMAEPARPLPEDHGGLLEGSP